MAEGDITHGIVAQSVADDTLSDDGFEFSPEEESILGGLLDRTDLDSDNPNQDPGLQLSNTEDDDRPREIRIPLYPFHPRIDSFENIEASSTDPNPASAEGTGKSYAKPRVDRHDNRNERESSASIEEPLRLPIEVPDIRSPLERFRTKPRKPFSVTDLISPSWCELQFWYGLTKGKRKRTPAMVKGTAVHKVLEDQVHTTVTVESTDWIKEDSLGLRIWNVIQGLRTLRETGMTREFEVWGLVDGLLVNGFIDELSTHCRDERLQAKGDLLSNKTPLLGGQPTIMDFLGGKTLESGASSVLRKQKLAARCIYITDVKTRSVNSLPRGSTFRPTLLQLMVYHRLLSDMVANKVDPRTVFDRYDLDGEAHFSDSFISQIGSLNEGFDNASQQLSQNNSTQGSSSQDSLSILLAHNSLGALWSLMMLELSETFPQGSRSIGKVLAAEYRDSDQGEVIGQKTVLYDEKLLNEYLASEMSWWRGERAPKGVCIEEAYKCGSCEFAEGCSWRRNKIEDAVLKMRERNRSQI